MRIFRKLILAWLAIFIAGCATSNSDDDEPKLVREYGFPMFYKWNDPNISETGLTKEQTDAAWKFISAKDPSLKSEDKQYFRVGTKDKKIYYFTVYCPGCFGTSGAYTHPMVLEDGEWKKFKTKYYHNVICNSIYFKELGYVGSEKFEEISYGSYCGMFEWEWVPCERSVFDKIKTFFRK